MRPVPALSEKSEKKKTPESSWNSGLLVVSTLLFVGGDFESLINGESGGSEGAGEENHLRREVERRRLGRRRRGEVAQGGISGHRRQLYVNVFGDAVGARVALQGRKLMLRQPLFRLQRRVLPDATLIRPQGDEQNRNLALRQVIAINAHDVLEGAANMKYFVHSFLRLTFQLVQV